MKTDAGLRRAFFDKPWNALATGDDTHDFGEPSVKTAGHVADADFDVMTAPRTAQPEAKTIYTTPTGLHVTDTDYRLLEKAAWFFRVRGNVLDSLAVKKNSVPANADTLLLRMTNGTVSWKLITMLNLLAMRVGAILIGALVGVSLGLAVSALVNTPTQSVMWVPLILIPQILFGSFVVIVPEMNDSVLGFSRALPSFNLQQVMDVGLILGRATPRMSNETKIPAFIDPPDKQEVVKWGGPANALRPHFRGQQILAKPGRKSKSARPTRQGTLRRHLALQRFGGAP